MDYANKKNITLAQISTNRANKKFLGHTTNYNSRTDMINKEFFKGIRKSNLRMLSSVVRVNKRFFKYTKRGNLQKVSSMLNNGFDVHIYYDMALRLSAKKGHVEIVIKLLEYGADIHTIFDEALRLGVYYNWAEIVEVLLKNGAYAHTALLTAIDCNNLNMVAILLEYGADICCNNEQILKSLQQNFNEEFASVILPYCCQDTYHYFPVDYIERNIVPTKSANMLMRNEQYNGSMSNK